MSVPSSFRASIAFATCSTMPEGLPDDALAAAYLRRRGIDVVSVPWEAHGASWHSFDAIIVRAAWTYHRKIDRFYRWLDDVAASGTEIHNPGGLLRWNADKRYLRDLEAAGVRVVPTMWIEGAAKLSARDVERSLGTLDVVVKPTVGASSEGVVRVDAADNEKLQAAGEAANGSPLLVQGYVSEVAEYGEWSLVYLEGQYSHAVLKRPAPGDFRVQEPFGGTTRSGDPSGALRKLAEDTLFALNSGVPLYARVDVVDTAAGPLLMELELIEPELFFRHGSGAAERFADAVVDLLERA